MKVPTRRWMVITKGSGRLWDTRTVLANTKSEARGAFKKLFDLPPYTKVVPV